MHNKGVKNWVVRHRKGLVALGVFIILVAIEHAVLYGSYYRHFGSVIGSEGDSYYNISLFMQNILNWKHGQFLSLQGDHISFYQNVIGVTAHVISPSVIFAILFPLLKNPILVYNLLFFGNIFLLQLGIYFLVRFYTKNVALAIFAALFVILSPAVVGIYYVGHIHASLYWSLPFLILLLEKALILQKPSKATLWKYAGGVFLCTLWLFFADWHVAIFSSVWIGLWFLFHIGMFRHPKKNLSKIAALVAPILLVVILVIPLAQKYFATSKIFNAERSIDVVVNTNMNLEDYLGFSRIIPSAIDIIKPFVKNHPYALDRLDHYKTIASHAGPGFPDPFFRAVLWGGLILFVPTLIVFIWSRGKTLKKELMLWCVVAVSAVLMVGPAIKMGGLLALERLPLPYFFLYEAFTPLHAIRALWRAATVGSLAVTVLLALLTNTTWYKVQQSKALPFSKHDKKNKAPQVVLYAFFVLAGIGLLVYQNNGSHGGTTPAQTKNDFFFSSMENHVIQDRPISFALVSDNMEDSTFNLQTSWFNLEHNRKAVEFAVGGNGGFLPLDWLTTINLTRQHQSLDQVVDMYSAKGVDVLWVDKKYLDEDPKARTFFARHYKKAEVNENYEVWVLASQAKTTKPEDLNYSLALSNFQEVGKNWNGMLNIENVFTTNFANPEKVHAIDYQFEAINSTNTFEEKFSLGEQAMIYAKSGSSVPVTLHPKLSPGSYTVTLKREGKVVWMGTREVLTHAAYQEKVSEAAKQELQLTSSVGVAPFSMDLYQVPVKLNLSVVHGGIFNQPKERVVRNNHPLVSMFVDKQNNPVTLQHFFTQPDCKFSGNLFAGDNVSFWCYQYVLSKVGGTTGKVEVE